MLENARSATHAILTVQSAWPALREIQKIITVWLVLCRTVRLVGMALVFSVTMGSTLMGLLVRLVLRNAGNVTMRITVIPVRLAISGRCNSGFTPTIA